MIMFVRVDPPQVSALNLMYAIKSALEREANGPM